ncbi:MAG: hypothetical protein AAFQ53_11610, partial [Bacteroidota bacterium]
AAKDARMYRPMASSSVTSMLSRCSPTEQHQTMVQCVVEGLPLPPGTRDNACALSTGFLAAQVRRTMLSQDGGRLDSEEAFCALAGLVEYVCQLTDMQSGVQDNGESWGTKALTCLERFWHSDGETARQQSELESRITERLMTADEIAQSGDVLSAESSDEQPQYVLPALLRIGTSSGSKVAVLQPDSTYIMAATAQTAMGSLDRSGLIAHYPDTYTDSESGKLKKLSGAVYERQFAREAEICGVVYSREPVDQDTFERDRRLAPLVPVSISPQGVYQLSRPVYLRSNLKAEYSEWAAAWIEQLCCGEEDHLALCTWLTYFPDVEGTQLPMMVLEGTESAAKTLLGQALSRILRTTRMGQIGNNGFTGHIDDAAFLLWDDSSPVAYNARTELLETISDMVLNMCMGQPVTQRVMRENPMAVALPWRLMQITNFSGFTERILKYAAEYASPAKARAIEKRLTRLTVPESARTWVEQNPAYSNDGELVAGKATEEMVARHIIWMHEHAELVAATASMRTKANFQRVREVNALENAEAAMSYEALAAARFIINHLHSQLVVGTKSRPDQAEYSAVFRDGKAYPVLRMASVVENYSNSHTTESVTVAASLRAVKSLTAQNSAAARTLGSHYVKVSEDRHFICTPIVKRTRKLAGDNTRRAVVDMVSLEAAAMHLSHGEQEKVERIKQSLDSMVQFVLDYISVGEQH